MSKLNLVCITAYTVKHAKNMISYTIEVSTSMFMLMQGTLDSEITPQEATAF